MKTVFLAAGHSETDPGVVANGRTEANIAVEFRNLVSFYLHRAGVPHELDGSVTENLPLREAVQIAKQHPIGLEFHCNGVADSKATGVETLSGPADFALGADLCRAIASAFGLRNRGAKPEDAGQHHRLAFVDAGGIIVELFFLTNPDDLAAYDARKWLAAKAVADILIAQATE